MQSPPKGEGEAGKELLLLSDSLQDGDALTQLMVDHLLQRLCSSCAVPDRSCSRERRFPEYALHSWVNVQLILVRGLYCCYSFISDQYN